MADVLILRFFLFLAGLLALFPPVSAYADDGRIFTLWPLIDYRHSDTTDYTNLNILGPFINYERKGAEREFALRPVYFKASDTEDKLEYTEILYPVGSAKSDKEMNSAQGLHLLNYDFGEPEKGSDNEFSLFPFIFAGHTEEQGKYFALFPVGGKLYDKFGRDEIRFFLFPLYGQTQKNETTTTNILWPVFARIRGNDEQGIKVWPFYSQSEKTGVYKKIYYMWPFFFSYDLKLDTSNPEHFSGAFPFFMKEESADRNKTTWLWPLFSSEKNSKDRYSEWNFPWPLFRITHGENRNGYRFLPLIADERRKNSRKRWFLWPIYKIEETQTSRMERRRDRILYFLYSDLHEEYVEGGLPTKDVVSFWPLFHYHRENGVSSFSTLALLEPFFPGKGGIERNWAPLWRLYQRKWDKQGNEISSLLWNLYWKERRGDNLAMEFFPLFSFRREAEEKKLSILKGLFLWEKDERGRRLRLFFVPWKIPLGGGNT